MKILGNIAVSLRFFLAFGSLGILLSSCSSMPSRYHTVAEGDTLQSIAQRYDVPVSDIKKHNPHRLASGVQPGTKLYIPFEAGRSWEPSLEAAATPSSAAGRQPTGQMHTVQALQAPIGSLVTTFNWPVSGSVSSYFGKRKRRMHDGIDIVAAKGVRVKAARSGHVIYAGNKINGYGNLVIVKHADSFSTVYAHLSKFDVKKGQFVARGQLLGRVGKTGHATNYHLHFEVRDDRVPVDPLLYLHAQVAANRIHPR